jgi:hypothetical protein
VLYKGLGPQEQSREPDSSVITAVALLVLVMRVTRAHVPAADTSGGTGSGSVLVAGVSASET